MSRVTIKQLLLAGAHFGHLTRRWNPKMSKYIFMEKNNIHIIDLQKTQRLLEEACNAIQHIVERGEDVLYVGTKSQAREMLKEEADRVDMFYVSERWLGGMLTNFRTIRNSVKTLETFESMATNGTYGKLHKKEILMVERKKEKLDRVLGGIRNMRRLPGALFVVDIRMEDIAVKEAHKLGIPVFAITDTNTDPDTVDYPIPANDDAYKSIALITHIVTDAILEAKMLRQEKAEVAEEEAVKQETKATPERKPRRRTRVAATPKEKVATPAAEESAKPKKAAAPKAPKVSETPAAEDKETQAE